MKKEKKKPGRDVRRWRRAKDALSDLFELYSNIDVWCEMAEKKLGELPCKKGCSYCCHQLVTVSIPECIAIVLYLKNVKGDLPGFVSRIRPRLVEQSEKLLRMETSIKQWFDDRTPCVFLDSEGSCTIYAERPSICRSVLVMPGSDCSFESEGAMRVDNRQITELTLMASTKAAEELGIPLGHAPLPIAFGWALTYVMRGRYELLSQLKGTIFADDQNGLKYWSLLHADDPKALLEEPNVEGKENRPG